MDRSLIYVSRRVNVTGDQQHADDEIVATARRRNAILHVTGGLVCTTHHFAQILEGSTLAIDELMHSMNTDPRHCDINVLDTRPILRRSLPNWSMGYSGGSTYVSRQVETLLLEDGSYAALRIERLRSLIIGFGKAEQPLGA